jgi:transposase
MREELQELVKRLVVSRKADGRGVYDKTAKAELVELSLKPGQSKSRLARECGINANQLSRWLREARAGDKAAKRPMLPAFVPIGIESIGIEAPPPKPQRKPVVPHLHARLPNGVVIELSHTDEAQTRSLLHTLAGLKCFASTKG